MRRRALCTATVHVSSRNGLGLQTWHFWRVDTTCSLSINKHTSYWESSLWIQRMAATAPRTPNPEKRDAVRIGTGLWLYRRVERP